MHDLINIIFDYLCLIFKEKIYIRGEFNETIIIYNLLKMHGFCSNINHLYVGNKKYLDILSYNLFNYLKGYILNKDNFNDNLYHELTVNIKNVNINNKSLYNILIDSNIIYDDEKLAIFFINYIIKYNFIKKLQCPHFIIKYIYSFNKKIKINKYINFYYQSQFFNSKPDLIFEDQNHLMTIYEITTFSEKREVMENYDQLLLYKIIQSMIVYNNTIVHEYILYVYLLDIKDIILYNIVTNDIYKLIANEIHINKYTKKNLDKILSIFKKYNVNQNSFLIKKN